MKMKMTDHLPKISSDESVILLLCTSLGRDSREVRPLTALSYDKVATDLRSGGFRPSDLMSERIDEAVKCIKDIERQLQIRSLLVGQLALSLRIESWQRVGGWIVTRASCDYPKQLRRLGPKTPPVLFGIGNIRLLSAGGLAVVGSRELSPEASDFARAAAVVGANEGLGVISGGARGADQLAMTSALAAHGSCIGVIAERLADLPSKPDWRRHLMDGSLCLVSPFDPDAPFSTGNAMGRNKTIYGLADVSLVVACRDGSGGTWAGAIENLREGWVPLLVNSPATAAAERGSTQQSGEAALVSKGARAVDLESLRRYLATKQWIADGGAPAKGMTDLFDANLD